MSRIYENRHNLAEIARNFDASPALTTGARQNLYFGSKCEVRIRQKKIEDLIFFRNSAFRVNMDLARDTPRLSQARDSDAWANNPFLKDQDFWHGCLWWFQCLGPAVATPH